MTFGEFSMAIDGKENIVEQKKIFNKVKYDVLYNLWELVLSDHDDYVELGDLDKYINDLIRNDEDICVDYCEADDCRGCKHKRYT